MITSTTELLNEITSICTSPSHRLLSKQSTLSAYYQKQRKEFALHYACMQAWFLRCSWLEKLKTLTQMLQELKSIDSLSLILNTLLSTCSKTTVYAECQYYTNFVYDKTLRDHNRSLQKNTFAATQDADIEWFGTLEEDYQQVLILIGLIRLGGGSVMHHVFEEGRRLYKLKVTEAEEAAKHNSLVDVKSKKLGSSGCNLPTGPTMHAIQQPMQSTPRSLNIKPPNMDELVKLDPKDPFVIEMEKRRKAWHEMIRKYRIQVEGKPASPKGKGKSDATSVKSKKSAKSGKSTKTTKSGKSSKKGKKGKKGEGEELDRIQLLPIWIVKKIFNYLDAKTLKKIKSVNKYWTYAVTDLQKEQKARKYLDKFISKMEAGIPIIYKQADPDEKPPVLTEMRNTSEPKKRLRRLWERGAVAPKLKIPLKKPLVKKSLATDTAMQTPENYLLPVQQMECFPRSWQKGAPPLYKVPSCLVNELGFTKIEYEELFSNDSSSISIGDNYSQHLHKAGHRIRIKESSHEFETNNNVQNDNNNKMQEM